jgi:phage shock protein A
MKRTGLSTLGVLAIALAVVGASSLRLWAEDVPEDKAAALRLQIRTIRDTKDPHEAKTAYARGCTADRSSIALHDIYMRKMLKFGLPQIAQYGARNLVGLDPANGLAWSVVSYGHAGGRRMNEAFAAGMKAGELIDSNPSVVYNTGALMAWQEKSGESLNLPTEVSRRKAAVKKAYEDKKPYEKAYMEIAAAYAERDQVQEAYEGKIEVIQGRFDEVREEAERIDRAMKRLYAKWEQLKTRVRVLWSRYHGMQDDPYWFPRDEDGNQSSHPVNRRAYERERRELRESIREAEQARDAVGREYGGLQDEGRPKVVALKKMKAEMEGLEKEAKAAFLKDKPAFEWKPPAVDGVVTPERELPRQAGSSSGGSTGATPGEAAKLLNLAKLYFSNSVPEKASETLRKIIAKYPDSEEAKQAKNLLEGTPR